MLNKKLLGLSVNMFRLIYSIALYFLSPLLVGYLAIRSTKNVDYRHRWNERFGLKKVIKTDVVIHCVSMGETLAAIPLIKQMRQSYPSWHITITSTSPTGSNEVIKAFKAELANGDMQHCYLPFDISISVRLFLNQLSPKYLIIMETELWPNLIHFAAKKQIKIMLANGRLSNKSLLQYKKLKSIAVPMLKSIQLFAMQTQKEAERLQELGVDHAKIKVCGSLKFDLSLSKQVIKNVQIIKNSINRNHAPIWISGSVHPGEFDLVINAHQILLQTYPDALLVMVPRHPEKFDLAAEKLQAAPLKFIRRSRNEKCNHDTQVILGDTMGELLTLYGVCDQAFVGGSFIVHGGHNPLEPAAFGLPVFMGPNYRDFNEIVNLLRDAGNLDLVENAKQLANKIAFLFEHSQAYKQASNAGLDVVIQNRGAINKQLECVMGLID